MAKRLSVGLILSLGLGVTTPIAYGQQQVQPAAPETASVQDLAQAVAQGDTESKERAIDELAARGSAAAAATNRLVAALADPQASVRWRAARALAEIGPAASQSVSALTAALKDRDPLVRAHAVRALGRMGDAAKGSAEPIAQLLADTDETVRRATVLALREIKPDRKLMLPLIGKLLERSGPSTRTLILSVLAEQGKEAVPALKEALANPEARYWACLVIAEIGPDAKETVPELLQAVKDEQPEVRHEALMALAATGDTSQATLDAAIAALADRENSVKYAAAYLLGSAGEAAAKAASQIQPLLRSDDPFLRTVAAWSLCKSNGNNQQVYAQSLDILLRALEDQDRNVRLAAIEAIDDLDPEPSQVLPGLIKAFEIQDGMIATNVADALVDMGKDAVPAVAAELKNPKLRRAAVVVLGRIGPDAKDAVPALVEALRGETDKDARREIFMSLSNIGPAQASIVPELLKDLKSDDIQLKAGATYALGAMGSAAAEALPEIRKNLAARDEKLRLLSVWALVRIAPENPQLVEAVRPILIAGLSHEEPLVRYEAAKTISLLGTAMQQATSRLQEVAENDPVPQVRDAAAEALKKVQQQ